MASSASQGEQGTQVRQKRESDRSARERAMPAAILSGPRQMRVEDVKVPEPGPGQVRVRLEGCGVCASNVPVWEGRPWFTYPLEPGAPGHEGWGVVEAVGSEATALAVGDRVALLSYHAYAACDVADAQAVVKLPAELDGVPFPGEPLGCAMNVFRRTEVQAGQTVAIVGIGFLGALLTRLVKNAGARVIAVSRRPFALESARQFGADEIFCMHHFGEYDRRKIVEQINGLSGGVGCDRAIEATGSQEALDLAAELVRVRGKLIIAGYHQDGLRQVNLQLWNWRGLDVINAHERDPAVYREGMQRAVEEVASGRLDPAPLYTHQVTLDRLSDAMELARQRPEGFLKALILLGNHKVM